MNNIGKYSVFKDDQIIKTGLCPSFYVHGMLASILERDQADWINIEFNEKKIRLYSPKTLYKLKPQTVTLEDHKKWFTGCRYPLE